MRPLFNASTISWASATNSGLTVSAIRLTS
jgi:hypothetical protein